MKKNSFISLQTKTMSFLDNIFSRKAKASHLAEEEIESMIESKEFIKLWVKTTVCLVTLKNGFEIVTYSSCIVPENYNQEIWEHLSYKKAIDRIRELEGYNAHYIH